MALSNPQVTDGFQLPSSIVGPVDVRRLRREAAALEDYLQQAELRQQEGVEPDLTKLPRTSPLFEDLVSANQLDMTQPAIRQRLLAFLEYMADDAPSVHVSFAADPSSAFIGKIVIWMRENISPLLLVRVGLQPNIAAGCVVRTTDHRYDLSLRQHFYDHREDLIKKLKTAVPSHE